MSTRDPVVTERWALAVLRVSLGGFLHLWRLEKFAIPTATVGIWAKFYGVGLAALWCRSWEPSKAASRSRSRWGCGAV
jgi:hypothetical protein